MAIKAAIFDLDGTVLDSMAVWNALDSNFLRSLGLAPKPGLQEAVMALTLRQSAAYFRKEYGVPLTEHEIINRIHDEIRKAYENDIPLKPGADRALKYLQHIGLPMAVATATEKHLAEAALRRLGILSFFSGIFTCEMVGKGKSDPDVYLAASAFLGFSRHETLVFEDAPFAAKTAFDAGFKVAVVHDDVSAGFGDTSFAHIRLTDFSELKKYIEAE
ncbi:MAG: HAD family hydrolase [Oscillospiraceae bacterium]